MAQVRPVRADSVSGVFHAVRRTTNHATTQSACHQISTSPPVGRRSSVMAVSVCACICLSVREHISGTTRPIFTQFFCACCLRPSLLAPPFAPSRCGMHFRFVDNVVFAHKGQKFGVSRAKRHILKVTRQVAVPISHGGAYSSRFARRQHATCSAGAESAVSDCIV